MENDTKESPLEGQAQTVPDDSDSEWSALRCEAGDDDIPSPGNDEPEGTTAPPGLAAALSQTFAIAIPLMSAPLAEGIALQDETLKQASAPGTYETLGEVWAEVPLVQRSLGNAGNPTIAAIMTTGMLIAGAAQCYKAAHPEPESDKKEKTDNEEASS